MERSLLEGWNSYFGWVRFKFSKLKFRTYPPKNKIEKMVHSLIKEWDSFFGGGCGNVSNQKKIKVSRLKIRSVYIQKIKNKISKLKFE